MLSIDITDREVKILKGAGSAHRVKVQRTIAKPFVQGTVVNGYVSDIPSAATAIYEGLKYKHIKDKTAVVSVSSSHIVFKELYIPKAKKEHFNAMVNNQIYSTMGISDEYSVTYTTVSENKSEDGAVTVKVLVTACPQKLLEGYKQLFAMLGITLKSVNISSSCITKVLLADSSFADRMPLLLVQVDKSFLNINLYEQRQLSFSRHVDIESRDIRAGEDYITAAVSENVFRMLQFYNTKRNVKPIGDIVLYGEIDNFDAMASSLSQLGLAVHMLSAPKSVVAKNFYFSVFANAVGALMGANEKGNQINLLQSISRSVNRKQRGYFVALAGITLVSIALVSGAFVYLKLQESDLDAGISEIRARIDSPENAALLAEIDGKQETIDRITLYNTHALAARDAFVSLPKAALAVFSSIEGKMTEELAITSVVMDGAQLTVSFASKNTTAPAEYVQALVDSSDFAAVSYGGYTVNVPQEQEAAAVQSAQVVQAETPEQSAETETPEQSAQTDTTEQSTPVAPPVQSAQAGAPDQYPVAFSVVVTLKGGDAQ